MPSFDHSVCDAKSMTNVISSRALRYSQEAELLRGNVNAQHAEKMFRMANSSEFPYFPHRLDAYRTPPVTSTMADLIGLLYGQSAFEEKYQLHMDNLEMEIQQLNILTEVICFQKAELQTEIERIDRRGKY